MTETTKPATTRARPGKISLDALERWLKKQNPETPFAYYDGYDCLNFRFIKAQGYDIEVCLGTQWKDSAGNTFELPRGMDYAAHTQTYGQALKQIKDIKKKE